MRPSLENPPPAFPKAFLLVALAAGVGLACAAKQKTVVTEEVGAPPMSQKPAPPEAPSAAAEAGPTPTAPPHLVPIYFEFDSATLGTEAREMLVKLGEYLRSNSSAAVIISGHADERGTTEYNLALGQKRAETARSYLARLGVRDSQLRSLSYGEERPALDGEGEEVWAKNRRDDFELEFGSASLHSAGRD